VTYLPNQTKLQHSVLYCYSEVSSLLYCFLFAFCPTLS